VMGKRAALAAERHSAPHGCPPWPRLLHEMWERFAQAHQASTIGGHCRGLSTCSTSCTRSRPRRATPHSTRGEAGKAFGRDIVDELNARRRRHRAAPQGGICLVLISGDRDYLRAEVMEDGDVPGTPRTGLSTVASPGLR